MIYLPDTDTVNYLVKKVGNAPARFRAETAAGASFALSYFVHFEVTRYLKLKGATQSHKRYDNLVADWQRIELQGTDWDDAANLWADRHRIGKPIEDSDLLIALTAKKCGATLVTNNTRHFEGLGVPLENWTA